MPTPAQNAATAKYKRLHTKRYVLECSKTKDADIIEHMEQCDGKNAYIKQAIREKMQRDSK